jgi:hypothetical protein
MPAPTLYIDDNRPLVTVVRHNRRPVATASCHSIEIVMMTDVTTTVVTIIMKTTTMIVATTGVTTDVMIVVAKMTTTTTTTTARNALHHRHQKGATPMVCFKPPTGRSTSSLVVDKRPRVTGSNDQMQERSGKSTLKLHNLCVG